MRAIFDGHNDALTREDHADLAAGRATGHLDLPRMARGGMRGGIFAVFSPSPGEAPFAPVLGSDGALELPPAAPLGHAEAAAHASAAADRLLALERA
ncbi:MAG: rane dipeptidase, partial [Solirubrobacterales bacterium]|nr:rane dipeptidase [Solirubrobacterales bacterium]